MKKWQIKIIVRNKYPYTNDTYDEIIREFFDNIEEANKRFNFILLNNYMFDGEIVGMELTEIISIRKVEKDGK